MKEVQSILKLINKAADEAWDAVKAMQYSQAALNAANALAVLEHQNMLDENKGTPNASE